MAHKNHGSNSDNDGGGRHRKPSPHVNAAPAEDLKKWGDPKRPIDPKTGLKICFFHCHGECVHGAVACKEKGFSHIIPPKAIIDQMERPPRNAERKRSPTPGPSKKSSGGHQNTVRGDTIRRPRLPFRYCFAYYDTGNCDKENCYPHMTRAEVDAKAKELAAANK